MPIRFTNYLWIGSNQSDIHTSNGLQDWFCGNGGYDFIAGDASADVIYGGAD